MSGDNVIIFDIEGHSKNIQTILRVECSLRWFLRWSLLARVQTRTIKKSADIWSLAWAFSDWFLNQTYRNKLVLKAFLSK